MNFEPQKFFIGLIEFFSVLLPGALLTYLLKDDVGPRFLDQDYRSLVGVQGWTAFIFTSYLLGHFIFLLGSQLDELYDAIRKAGYTGQLGRLAKGEALSPVLARWLAVYLLMGYLLDSGSPKM